MDLEAFRKDIKGNLYSSESTLWFRNVKEEVSCVVNGPCYISAICHPYPIQELWVFNNPFKNRVEFVNFILNSKLFGPCFITKDAEEGYETGFEVDCSQPSNLILAAIISLRSAFENVLINQNFLTLKGMGYTDEEAFYFGSLIGRKIGSIDRMNSNSPIMHGLMLHRVHSLRSVEEGLLGDLNRPLNKEAKMRSPFDGSSSIGGKHLEGWDRLFQKHSQGMSTKTTFATNYWIPSSRGSVEELITLYKEEYGHG